jgi:hypothetical protein
MIEKENILLTSILTTKMINIIVNEFYSIRGLLTGCFSPFKFHDFSEIFWSLEFRLNMRCITYFIFSRKVGANNRPFSGGARVLLMRGQITNKYYNFSIWFFFNLIELHDLKLWMTIHSQRIYTWNTFIVTC